MTIVTSFRIVYVSSRVFGIFPYVEANLNEFYVSKRILQFAKYQFWLLLVIRVLIFYLEIRWNEGESLRNLAVFIRLGNTTFLNILTVIAYRNVCTSCNGICNWLNRLSRLHSSIQGDFKKLYNFNLCIAFYSVTFYCVTNVPTCVILLKNGNFLKGSVAAFDSMTFVYLLLFQNIYLVQFLTLINLARSCFCHINCTLQSIPLKENPREILTKLQKLRVQHLEVTDFYKFINSVYEFYIFFYIIYSFQSALLCSAILVTFDSFEGFVLCYWLSYHIFQNLPLLTTCEHVSTESKRSANYVHELMIQDENQEVKEQIEIFSLQLQHRAVEFTVCGFFTLESKLFLTICGIIITYVITLFESQPTTSYQQTNATIYET